MATLYITELKNLTTITSAAGQLVQAPFIGNGSNAEQHLSLTTTSTQSSAWSAGTNFIMVNTDIACCLVFGGNTASITATTTSHRMGPNETRFYGVNAGGTLATISAS